MTVALALAAGAVRADEPPARTEVVPEMSPYYTALGLYVPLRASLPERSGDDEVAIYRELFLDSLHPQLLLLEASVYPMPVLGTWVRRHDRGFYDDADIGHGINWIQSLTAGFQEPAAASIFVGSAVNFVRPGEERRGTNKGMMGYLASFGDRHIKENVMIPDDWYELEWKLKGDRNFSDDHLSWSFRIGTKQHSNPDIADTVYVGLRRSNIDYRAPFLAWLTNSEVEMMAAATTDGFSLARWEFLLEKRYPIERFHFAVAVQTGVVMDQARSYSGALRDGGDNFVIVLRPNLEF